jgi:drug/metabolite transporter (DMT)-like permease
MTPGGINIARADTSTLVISLPRESVAADDDDAAADGEAWGPSYTATPLPPSLSSGAPAAQAKHAGRRCTRSQAVVAFYVLLVTVGYGLSMLINGVGKRLVPARTQWGPPGYQPPAGAPADADALRTARVLAGVLDPMFMLATGRTVALGAVLAVMAVRGDMPAAPPPLSRRLLVPLAIGACNSGGYAFFMALCTMSGVAVWSALVGLYVLLPVGYGLLMRGERRTRAKLAGIACCVGAALLLGLAQAAEDSGDAGGSGSDGAARDESDGHPLVKLALFAVCITLWGVCDGMSAYVNRGPGALHMFTIATFTTLGFGAVAWLCAVMSFFLEAAVPPVVLAVGETAATGAGSAGGVSAAGGYAVLFAAQALGILGWYSTVKLGSMAEASTFLPLSSLYTLVTAVMGLLVLGESMPPLGYGGLALGAAGIVLISQA